jgi:probable rRNA maturation factor
VTELRIDVNFGPDVAADAAAQDIELAVRHTLEHEGIEAATIAVTLLADPQITDLNRQYLQHDAPTDVLSFPLYEEGEEPVGDIYIGYEQAQRQSAELAVPLAAELARLAIHGTLHVLGYDHPEEGARDQSEMWERQEAILRAFLGQSVLKE